MNGLDSQKNSPSEQFERSSAIHAALQEFEFGDLTFCLAVAVGEGNRCQDRRFVTLESGCKTAKLREVSFRQHPPTRCRVHSGRRSRTNSKNRSVKSNATRASVLSSSSCCTTCCSVAVRSAARRSHKLAIRRGLAGRRTKPPMGGNVESSKRRKSLAKTVQDRPDRALWTRVALCAHIAPELQPLTTALLPALAEVVGVRREGTWGLAARFPLRKPLDPIPAFDRAPTDPKLAGHRVDRPPLSFEELEALVAVQSHRAPLTQLGLLTAGSATAGGSLDGDQQPSGVGSTGETSVLAALDRCRSRICSTTSLRSSMTWKRSATWTACGAPRVAPSAYAVLRSRVRTSTLGMRFEPAGKSGRRAILEQLNRVAQFFVHQDGSIRPASP